MNNALLKCKLTLGQFSSEYVIQGQEYNGSGYSAFVPQECVQLCDEKPEKGRLVDGFVMVRIVGEQQNLKLVRLPRQTLENGQLITVTEDQLEFDGPPSHKNDTVGCGTSSGD